MMKKAFTLIELMVVIAIIGVLLAVISPQVFRQINKGKTAACEQFYAAVKTGATSFYSDNMSWPADTNGFLITTGAATWDGPYLDRWQSTNPWGGVFTWVNQTGTTFGASAGERYITATLVPAADSARIDLHTDGTSGATTGWVRYSGTTLSILVSRDGPVS
ncbi:MAG: prepilin-type N-terminal cleavage/methylation domain-containing protein [Candidatus Omnitrophota bacterium]